jgi:hypothetical protein
VAPASRRRCCAVLEVEEAAGKMPAHIATLKVPIQLSCSWVANPL